MRAYSLLFIVLSVLYSFLTKMYNLLLERLISLACFSAPSPPPPPPPPGAGVRRRRHSRFFVGKKTSSQKILKFHNHSPNNMEICK